MIGILQPLFGAIVILAIAVAFSNNRRAINWSTVAWGLSLQIIFALIVLKTSVGQRVFETLGAGINKLLGFAGVIGFIGNEIAAQIRLRAGARLGSAALVADGRHARVDGVISLGVIASAAVVALGVEIADPIIGLIITLVILRIAWQSWQTVRTTQIDIDHFEHHRL